MHNYDQFKPNYSQYITHAYNMAVLHNIRTIQVSDEVIIRSRSSGTSEFQFVTKK